MRAYFNPNKMHTLSADRGLTTPSPSTVEASEYLASLPGAEYSVALAALESRPKDLWSNNAEFTHVDRMVISGLYCHVKGVGEGQLLEGRQNLGASYFDIANWAVLERGDSIELTEGRHASISYTTNTDLVIRSWVTESGIVDPFGSAHDFQPIEFTQKQLTHSSEAVLVAACLGYLKRLDVGDAARANHLLSAIEAGSQTSRSMNLGQTGSSAADLDYIVDGYDGTRNPTHLAGFIPNFPGSDGGTQILAENNELILRTTPQENIKAADITLDADEAVAFMGLLCSVAVGEVAQDIVQIYRTNFDK